MLEMGIQREKTRVHIGDKKKISFIRQWGPIEKLTLVRNPEVK